jgi:predicted O-methyltransferase YrrM
MRLHIINPYGSSAMNRMVAPLLSEMPKLYEVTTGEAIDPAADVNFHMPWHTLVGQDKGNGKHVIAYTHCNPPDRAALADACERADLITCMSYEGRRELVEMGVDPAKLWVVYCAADFQFRKRLIGIVGYPQPNGRKRESIIMDLAWQMDLTPFQFLFVGDGWDEFVAQLQSVGVAAGTVHADTPQKLADIYNRLDVLLVTGYVEGGPLPLLEAMAAGVQVLSPRFGYAADLLDYEQIYDDLDGLKARLEEFAAGSIHRHHLARAWSWRDYAAEYAMLFGRLTGESVDLYPERGMSRYTQLLDVIDETKPAHIAEIGTWNGHNAARMIQAAAKYHQICDVYYQGFDLFELMTGEQFRRELSKHGWEKRVVEKKLEATGAGVWLKEGDTTITLQDDVPLDYELYFVDGGHSEETIDNDGDYAISCLRGNNVAIFDDYYHEGKPEGVGCNKFIDALPRDDYEVTFLPVLTTADDGRVIGMVRVERRKTNDANLYLQVYKEAQAGDYPDGSAGNFISYTTMYPLRGTDAPGTANVRGELERTTPAQGTSTE